MKNIFSNVGIGLISALLAVAAPVEAAFPRGFSLTLSHGYLLGSDQSDESLSLLTNNPVDHIRTHLLANRIRLAADYWPSFWGVRVEGAYQAVAASSSPPLKPDGDPWGSAEPWWNAWSLSLIPMVEVPVKLPLKIRVGAGLEYIVANYNVEYNDGNGSDDYLMESTGSTVGYRPYVLEVSLPLGSHFEFALEHGYRIARVTQLTSDGDSFSGLATPLKPGDVVRKLGTGGALNGDLLELDLSGFYLQTGLTYRF